MNIVKKIAAVLLLAALALPAFAPAAQADDGWRHDRHWHGEARRFHNVDLNTWHSGHWFHGRHEGRIGWWWAVGNNWYFYAQPVYPYPDPTTPPFVAAGAPLHYVYYCRHSAGYYPYVAACAGRWHPVLAP